MLYILTNKVDGRSLETVGYTFHMDMILHSFAEDHISFTLRIGDEAELNFEALSFDRDIYQKR